MSEVSWKRIHSPLAVALAVTVCGVVGLLLVDHGPWNKPHLQSAEVHYPTTKAAAAAVGATVTPSDPRPAIEPEARGRSRRRRSIRWHSKVASAH